MCGRNIRIEDTDQVSQAAAIGVRSAVAFVIASDIAAFFELADHPAEVVGAGGTDAFMHLLVDDPLCLEHIFGQHILEIFANTALELPAATVAAGHARQALADIFAQRELLFVFDRKSTRLNSSP